MENKKEIVYNYLLENCKGKENTQKGWQIRIATGFNRGDKMFRSTIQEINADGHYEYLVGAVSGSGENAGYFIATTEEEENEIINNIKHRANQMLRNTHVMKWKCKLRRKHGKKKDV
jgi:imidazole glycerol phosphate synthase subunit HisF